MPSPHQPLDVVSPLLERRSFLFRELMPLIHPHDAGERTGNVVQHFFDNVPLSVKTYFSPIRGTPLMMAMACRASGTSCRRSFFTRSRGNGASTRFRFFFRANYICKDKQKRFSITRVV
jgi:hypothetical protein